MTFLRRCLAPVALLLIVALGAGASPVAAATSPAIAGTVYAPGGTRAPNICVYAFDAATGAFAAQVATTSTGTYSIPLPVKGYRLAFVDCAGKGYATQWYSGMPTSSVAATVSSPKSGVSATMSMAATISGRVLDPSGGPAANVCVYVFDGPTSAYLTVVGTAADGTYAITGLLPRQHRLAFTDCGGRGWVTGWGTGAATSLATEVPITAPAAGLTTRMRDGLEHARAAIAARATTAANIVFLGDSITAGFSAGTREGRYTDLVRSALDGGGGGIGYEPAAPSEIGGLAYPAIWQTTSATPNMLLGLGKRALDLTSSASAASLTVTTDELWLLYTGRPGGGSITISIDDRDVATIATAASTTTGGLKWSSGALPLGTHTLRVRAVPGAGGTVATSTIEGAMVFAGDRTSGVREWEAGHAGYTAAIFDRTNPWYGGITTAAPDLVTIGFGTNEANGGVAPADYEAQLGRLIDLVREKAPSTSVAVLLMPAPGALLPETWNAYLDAGRRAAAAHGAGTIDVNAAVAAVPQVDRTVDGVHPNALGEQLLANAILTAVGQPTIP